MMAFTLRLWAVLILLQLVCMHSILAGGGKEGDTTGEVLLESSDNPGHKALYFGLRSGNFIAEDTRPTISQTELIEAGGGNQFIKLWECTEDGTNLTYKNVENIGESLTRWNTASVLSVHIKIREDNHMGNTLYQISITFLLTAKKICEWPPIQRVVTMLNAANLLINNPNIYSQPDFKITDSDHVMVIWTDSYYSNISFAYENVLVNKLRIAGVEKVHKICIWGPTLKFVFRFSCRRLAEESFIPMFHQRLATRFPISKKKNRVKYIANEEDMEPDHRLRSSHVKIQLRISHPLEGCITKSYFVDLGGSAVQKIYLLLLTGNYQDEFYYVFLIKGYYA